MKESNKESSKQTKQQWSKPTLTEVKVKDTQTGPYSYPIEDPYNSFYGPGS